MNSKTSSLILTHLVLAIGVVSECAAQQFVPVQHTISTPYGNVTTTTNMMVGGYNYGNGTSNPSRKYKFTIVLKNDSTFTVKKRIDISKDKHVIHVKVKGKKVEITPDQTKEISRISYMANDKLTGIPSGNYWLFLSIQGRISAYSYLAEVNSEYLVAVKKYDGPIVKITDQSLREMLDGNEKALKYLEKKQYKNAIEAYNVRR